jgi:NADPH-dependent 7-cyano-7-deazaguanine reductase QueF-like protein
MISSSMTHESARMLYLNIMGIQNTELMNKLLQRILSKDLSLCSEQTVCCDGGSDLNG